MEQTISSIGLLLIAASPVLYFIFKDYGTKKATKENEELVGMVMLIQNFYIPRYGRLDDSSMAVYDKLQQGKARKLAKLIWKEI